MARHGVRVCFVIDTGLLHTDDRWHEADPGKLRQRIPRRPRLDPKEFVDSPIMDPLKQEIFVEKLKY